MQHYIARVLPEYDFYVPFSDPLYAGEVLAEIRKQLGIYGKDMKLLFNGKVINNETLLSDAGVQCGSIVYVYIKNFDKIYVMTPKRMLREIFSLYNNLACSYSECFKSTVHDIKELVNSPKLQALAKIVPKLQTIFDDIVHNLDEIDAPLDNAAIMLYSKCQDDWFNQCELLPNGMSQILHDGTEIVSVADIELANDDDIIEKEEVIIEDEEIPLNLDYSPSISTTELPVPQNFDITYYTDLF